jgi:hypothetical protein
MLTGADAVDGSAQLLQRTEWRLVAALVAPRVAACAPLRYSLYLLYWYKSTDANAAGALLVQKYKY